jgi:hypothetical protein
MADRRHRRSPPVCSALGACRRLATGDSDPLIGPSRIALVSHNVLSDGA